MKIQVSTTVEDPQVRQVLLEILNGFNGVAQFLFEGEGEPTTSDPAGVGQVTVVPSGAGIFFRRDPSPGAAVYLFDGTNWTAVV